jgi:hypothetical protein
VLMEEEQGYFEFPSDVQQEIVHDTEDLLHPTPPPIARKQRSKIPDIFHCQSIANNYCCSVITGNYQGRRETRLFLWYFPFLFTDGNIISKPNKSRAILSVQLSSKSRYKDLKIHTKQYESQVYIKIILCCDNSFHCFHIEHDETSKMASIMEEYFIDDHPESCSNLQGTLTWSSDGECFFVVQNSSSYNRSNYHSRIVIWDSQLQYIGDLIDPTENNSHTNTSNTQNKNIIKLIYGHDYQANKELLFVIYEHGLLKVSYNTTSSIIIHCSIDIIYLYIYIYIYLK